MSYVLVMAPDAQSELRSLDIRFQEMALDEIDRLCQNPPMRDDTVSDLIVDEDTIRHYLFVRVRPDHKRRVLTVAGIGYVNRAKRLG